MLGYLGGPRIGAVSYNLSHTYAPPGLLAAFGLLTGSSLLVPVALVWFSHIGFDRMVGFGLMYPTGRTSSVKRLWFRSPEYAFMPPC